MRAGEDRTLSLVARDASGAILDLTGATIAWRLTLNPGDSSLVAKTGTVVSTSLGTFTVALSASDTSGLFGDYEHQATATIAGAVTMCARGTIRVEALNQA